MLADAPTAPASSTDGKGGGIDRGPPRSRPIPLSIREASAGLRRIALDVPLEEMVFVKGVVEASEGLASVFAEAHVPIPRSLPRARYPERRPLLVVASHVSRAAELETLVADLTREARVTVIAADDAPESAEIATSTSIESARF